MLLYVMRAKYLILLMVVGSLSSGCTWVRESFPWFKKDVPLTAPSSAESAGDEETSPPDQERLTGDEENTEAGQVLSRADIEPGIAPEGSPGPPRWDISPEPLRSRYNSPAARGAERRRIEAPIPLENIGPGGEDFAKIEVPSGLPAIVPEHAPIETRPAAQTYPSVLPTTRPIAQTYPSLLPTSRPIARTYFRAPATSGPTETVDPKGPAQLPSLDEIEYGKPVVVAASLIQLNDRFFTVEDIMEGAGAALSKLPGSLGEENFRSRALDILRKEIDNRVIETLAHAQAQNRLTERQKTFLDNELERTLASMIAEAGGSKKKLEAHFEQEGTDLETFLNDQRRRLTIQIFLRTRLYPAVSINRAMLWEYYRENRLEFTSDKKVQMQIIAAPYSKFGVDEAPSGEGDSADAGSQASKSIEAAAAAIRSGEDFGEVARRLSRGIKAPAGGLWGMMGAGSFREIKVEQVAFTLDEGHVSDIIETDTGYYIVKVYKVHGGRVVSFEDAQELIERKLRREQFAKLERKYFEELLAGAHIKKSDEFLDLAVDRAVRTYFHP